MYPLIDSCRLIYIDPDGITSLHDQLVREHADADQALHAACPELRIRRKLGHLLVRLQQDACLFTNLNDATMYVLLHQNGVAIIHTDITFDVPQIATAKDSTSAFRQIVRAKTLLYVTAAQVRVNADDQHCGRASRLHIVMPSSVFKYRSLQCSGAQTKRFVESLDVLMRGVRAGSVKVNVIGAMYFSRDYFRISPYVIQIGGSEMKTRTSFRWERVNKHSYDLILVNPETIEGETREALTALLNNVCDEHYCDKALSDDAVKEFRRWLEEPETPLQEQAYARLSNWFLTDYHGGSARISDLGVACGEFWDALFCTRPKDRLTAPLKDHKILPEEFETWWAHQFMFQDQS